MLNLSPTQMLSLWSELEQAFHKTNKYGGDTAEIYIHRAMTYRPSVGNQHVDELMADDGSIIGAICREAYDDANASLYNLFALFAENRNAYIEVDSKPLGSWLKSARSTHRVHVRVRSHEELDANDLKPEVLFTVASGEDCLAVGNFQAKIAEQLDERKLYGLTHIAFRSKDGGDIEVVALKDED